MIFERDPSRWPGTSIRWIGGATAVMSILALSRAAAVSPPDAMAGAPPGEPAEARSAPARSIEEANHIPAGISDAEGAVGCLRTPDGGVEAVDLATGRSLWRSAAPARALLIARGRAFVLEERGGRLRLSARAARAGRPARDYDLAALSLPPWASPGESAAGHEWTEFKAAGRLAGDTLEIRCAATRRRVTGFQGVIVIGQVDGAIRVDLDSGRVTPLPGPAPSPPPITDPAPTPPGTRLLSIHARPAEAMLVFGGPPPNVDGALIVGDRRLQFELSPDTRAVIVHGRRVPGGQREPPLRLEHRQRTDAVWATLDRRHVLLRRADDQAWYDLYSVETGEPIGTLERPVDIAVVGPRIFWTRLETGGALTLVATKPGSGRKVWKRMVRGPDPPLGEPIP